MWSRFLVNLGLLAFYVYYFGAPSMKKYMEKGIIIIKTEETHSSITPPVIIVMPTNPSTGTGWKKGADIPCKKDIVQCIEKNAYLEHEVLVNVENHVQVTDFFHDIQNAMWKLLKFDPGIITYILGSPTVSIPASSIQLNATLIYYLAFLDPSLQFWADSPDIFPRSFQRLKENTNYLVNMKAIRHEKLNLPNSPCEPSMDYSLGKCIEDYILKEVGCQPHWRIFDVKDVPLCDNWTQLVEYSNLNSKFKAEMLRSKILETSGCKPPCTIMEYKISDSSMEIDHFPQLPEGISLLILSFTSNVVEVQKEQMAFPFISLVAEIGGVLGLFIGFNFLMVWDWTVGTVKKVWQRNFHLFNCIYAHNVS